MNKPITSHRNASGAKAPSRKLPTASREKFWVGVVSLTMPIYHNPPPIQMMVMTSPSQMRQSRSVMKRTILLSGSTPELYCQIQSLNRVSMLMLHANLRL
jgi:hypothetical protein